MEKQFCNLCGGEVKNGVCSRCGNIVSVVKEDEPRVKPKTKIRPEVTQKVRETNIEQTREKPRLEKVDEEKVEEEERSVSMLTWLGRLMLLSIPAFNIVYAIRTLATSEDRTFKNYVKASIIMTVLTYAITFGVKMITG